MNFQHPQLAAGGWTKQSLPVQMANVGSEVIRAMNWQKKKNQDYSRQAFERALELLDLTLADSKNRYRLKEIARTRELLADYFTGKNEFKSTSQLWQNYFLAFNYLARKAL